MAKQYDKRIRRGRRGIEKGNTHRFTQNDSKTISNVKMPGHDGIHVFWFEKSIFIHKRQALEMNRCLQVAHVPKRMTKRKTILIQKNPSQGTAPNNYRTITWLPIIWKILTTQIREEIYCSLTSRGLFPEEQRGGCKESRGTVVTLHRSAHSKREQDQAEKSNYGLHWLQKGIWYVPAKQDNTLPQNVQNIT